MAADVTFARLEGLAREYAQTGAVQLQVLDAALPESATAEDMDAAIGWLAARSIQVIDAPVTLPVTRAASAPEEPSFLERFFDTPFALARLFAAAEAGSAMKTGVFADGLSDEALTFAVALVADLRQAHERAEEIRSAIRAKKLSQSKRRELLVEKRASEVRARALIRELPLSDEWVARAVSVFTRAAQVVEESRTKRDSLASRVGRPIGELRQLLREARKDENEAERVARRMRISRAGVQQLDDEIRLCSTRIAYQQKVLGIAADRILILLPLAREWKARRRREKTRPRAVGGGAARGGPVLLDLVGLEAQAEEIATRATVGTSVPRVQRGAAMRQPPARRAALAARRDADAAVESPGGGTLTDLGRVGEAVIFSMMRNRWLAAASSESGRTAALLRAIADEYWALAPAQTAALEVVLADEAGKWLESALVRDLLWPARTAYGDALGFDLVGLAEDRAGWLCVEVKTTLGPPSTQFELTANEYDRAAREGPRYVIARVAHVADDRPSIHFWRDPAALVSSGALRLIPSSFTVSLVG